MMAKPTTKTRIFMISDTHQGFERDEMYSGDGAFRPPFPNADVLLHSGDLTMTGQIEEYRGALAMLKAMPAELKLVIAGNHDLSLHKDYYLNAKDANGNLHAHRLDEEYDPRKTEIAESLWAKEARDTGVVYLTEGLHEFSLSNGAQFTIYSSPWQPEFCNWAFNYPHNEDRWNPPAFVDRDTVRKEGVRILTLTAHDQVDSCNRKAILVTFRLGIFRDERMRAELQDHLYLHLFPTAVGEPRLTSVPPQGIQRPTSNASTI
jgi:hypothetical protein